MKSQSFFFFFEILNFHFGFVNRMLKEQENAFEEEDDDDDDDPVFVLTDEWKEFFAKSEAERKLKKKQANKEKK
ncbi:hypothetical protein FEM48_Zijuj09G0081800 [Ziziphus jujuba var. spinosa]|uniref:Uncharacterized protein n=1 Tax=Ziziphus jujuba var. spinosa TaxID=714518 RepID=A0A978URU7_ZIZJJ|nr:hypothetical protein FEM48_Zijuj09G0081800 [Ziziphus jujuba var. spinosa]